MSDTLPAGKKTEVRSKYDEIYAKLRRIAIGILIKLGIVVIAAAVIVALFFDNANPSPAVTIIGMCMVAVGVFVVVLLIRAHKRLLQTNRQLVNLRVAHPNLTADSDESPGQKYHLA